MDVTTEHLNVSNIPLSVHHTEREEIYCRSGLNSSDSFSAFFFFLFLFAGCLCACVPGLSSCVKCVCVCLYMKISSPCECTQASYKQKSWIKSTKRSSKHIPVFLEAEIIEFVGLHENNNLHLFSAFELPQYVLCNIKKERFDY